MGGRGVLLEDSLMTEASQEKSAEAAEDGTKPRLMNQSIVSSSILCQRTGLAISFLISSEAICSVQQAENPFPEKCASLCGYRMKPTVPLLVRTSPSLGAFLWGILNLLPAGCGDTGSRSRQSSRTAWTTVNSRPFLHGEIKTSLSTQ